MKSEETVMNRMRCLSDYLRQEESLIPGVLERLESEVVVSKQNTTFSRIRFRLAVTAATFLLMGIALVWMRPSGLGASVAYAEVRQAIRNIESVIVVRERPGKPHEDRRVLYRRDTNTLRVECPNGFAWVSDPQLGEWLVLDTKGKTAQLLPGLLEAFSAAKHLDEMANLAGDSVEPLGERTIDGRKLTGFRIKQPNGEEGCRDTIWVDPETQLPAIRESTRAATKFEKGHSFRQVYTFNQPLGRELFSMTPPDGYRLVSSDAPSILRLPELPLPAEGLPPGPTLRPGIGIGEVRFGMKMEQIVEVLGKADSIRPAWSHTPEESRLIKEAYRKARNLDKFEGQHLIDEAESKVAASAQLRGPSEQRMTYDSLGIELIVAVDGGLTGGFCWDYGHGDNYPYTGKTTEGIGIGSTMAEIEEAYGKPDGGANRKSDHFGVWYESRGLHFMISDGKVSYIGFNQGHEANQAR